MGKLVWHKWIVVIEPPQRPFSSYSILSLLLNTWLAKLFPMSLPDQIIVLSPIMIENIINNLNIESLISTSKLIREIDFITQFIIYLTLSGTILQNDKMLVDPTNWWKGNTFCPITTFIMPTVTVNKSKNQNFVICVTEHSLTGALCTIAQFYGMLLV